jgi:hypothetical protein
MAVKGQRVSRFFGKPEIVKMKCDVHSWMASHRVRIQPRGERRPGRFASRASRGT